jgi:outer membrane murein-binding lipoprotein Lpp
VSLELQTAAPAQTPQRFADRQGVKPATSPDGHSGFLDDVIVDLGLATRELVDEAVEEGRQTGKVAGDLLVESGAITEEQLSMAIAERNGLPYVDIFQFTADDGAASLIPPDTARRYRALPIAFDADGAIVVALADPLDALAVSDIGVIARSEVRVAVASDAGIEALLRTLPQTQPVPLAPQPGLDADWSPQPAIAEPEGWNLAQSISSPDPFANQGEAPEPRRPYEPMVEPQPETEFQPEPDSRPVDSSALANVSPALASRIEEVIVAALDDLAASDVERLQAQVERSQIETEQARMEAERAREDAEQARGEVEALSRRLEELERHVQPPVPVEPGASF